jgi:hypothetical protein
MHPYWKGYLKLALVSCPIAPLCAGKWPRRANARECHGAARGNEPSLTRHGLSAP